MSRKEDDIPMKIKMGGKCFPSIMNFKKGEKADESEIINLLDFIDLRLDCADFRMVCILRTLYDYSALVSEETLSRIKKTLLGFKYWMDEPGEDSMCYWSENHQLLFATSEYLAGHYYPDDIFTNNGMTGKEHEEKAKVRLVRWFERRFQYGFVEWLSNTYYEEDAGPLSLLIDLSPDENISRMATMALDMILSDIAMHSFEKSFSASSGRCYEKQKKYPETQDTVDLMAYAFGWKDWKYDYERLIVDLLLNRTYKVPEVIRRIYEDRNENYTECTHGLDLDELDREFRGRDEMEDRGAFSWAMESFSNTKTIQTTMKMYHKYHMATNIFLQDLKCISAPILGKLHLLPFLVWIVNPLTQGVAIERANTATLRRPEYMLSTAQMYHPKHYGDQQHIWQASMKGGISVFTTHPAVSGFDDNARNFSPGYWVGNGRLPSSIQNRNINLTLYDLRGRKGMLEKSRQMLSHAFFPFGRFDEWSLSEDKRVLLGRKEDGYIALLSANPMDKIDEEELVQRGILNGWACIMGAEETDGSFEEFKLHALSMVLKLRGSSLTLVENGKEKMKVTPRKAYIDGKERSFDYPRLNSTYGDIPRNPDKWKIQHEGCSLELDFRSLERKETKA